MGTILESQFAAINLIYSRCSFDYFLDSVSRLNIHNIELWGVSPFFCTLDQSTSNIDNIRKAIEKREIKLISFIPEQCMYPLNIASNDKNIRQRTVNYYKEHIKIAKELGASKVLVTPGWSCIDEPIEEGYKRSEEGLQKIVPAAIQQEIELVLEILQPCESNLLYNLKTMLWYAGKFKSDELNFCVDTVPVKLAGETLEQYFGKLKKRVRHIHLVDGTPTGHMVLGDGEHSIREHMDTLAGNNYDGYITLEFGNSAYFKNPEFHMKRGWNYLKRLLPYSCAVKEEG